MELNIDGAFVEIKFEGMENCKLVQKANEFIKEKQPFIIFSDDKAGTCIVIPQTMVTIQEEQTLKYKGENEFYYSVGLLLLAHDNIAKVSNEFILANYKPAIEQPPQLAEVHRVKIYGPKGELLN